MSPSHIPYVRPEKSETLTQAIRRSFGTVTEAARILGIGAKYVHNWCTVGSMPLPVYTLLQVSAVKPLPEPKITRLVPWAKASPVAHEVVERSQMVAALETRMQAARRPKRTSTPVASRVRQLERENRALKRSLSKIRSALP